ncbi:hypothetical protein Hanom_Chr11g01051741 [Helianthus anomalus]
MSAASIHVCSFSKRTDTNKLPVERFTNYLLNVWFVCSPIFRLSFVGLFSSLLSRHVRVHSFDGATIDTSH